ncbi:hypothetical protein CHARACLAT_023594 [Characodon lateralis]|uniref:Uncharacterized protein n=1 Tax=Characodon lateralis TaxID=208331 RepID=A0ABU7DTM9_9TELE|nr:hypothetical protein [Characodon lateralis]
MSNSPVPFIFSPSQVKSSKMILMLPQAHEYLNQSNVAVVSHVLNTSVCGSPDSSSTPCEYPQNHLYELCSTILSRLWLSLFLIHIFLSHFILPLNFPLICLDSSTL